MNSFFLFFIEWEDLTARIIRPNMECSNGMIHVIDKVILKERDITLAFSNSPGSIVNSIFVTMLAAILVNVVNVQWENNKQKENKRMIGDCQIVEVI